MGVPYRFNDKVATACALATIVGSSNLCSLGMKIPGLAKVLDRSLTRKLGRLLETYGHADFITDASEYKLVGATQSSSASA
jgi:predicted sugar kinase